MSFTVGALPPGVQGSGLFLQVAFAGVSQVILSAPSHVLLLDQSL